MKTLMILFAFLAIQSVVVAKDFEISFIDKSDVMKFAKETAKVVVTGDDIPEASELLVTKDKGSLDEYISLKDFIDAAEKDIEEMLDSFTTENKSFKEKQKLKDDFANNIKKLEKLVKEAVTKIENEIKEKQKLKKVFATEDRSWDVKITYPGFRYEYIVDEQNKAYASLLEDLQEEEKKVNAEKRKKKFEKELLPKLNKIIRRAEDHIEDCSELDKTVDELEQLYDDLQEYLEKDMVDKLRGEKSYASLQQKFEKHLEEIDEFPQAVKYVIRDIDKIIDFATKESGFRLLPKHENDLVRIKNDLRKEKKDFANMTKKAQEIHDTFASQKAWKRIYKRFKNKKEIKKFLAEAKKSKKAIRKIDVKKPLEKMSKIISKISFIPREQVR